MNRRTPEQVIKRAFSTCRSAFDIGKWVVQALKENDYQIVVVDTSVVTGDGKSWEPIERLITINETAHGHD